MFTKENFFPKYNDFFNLCLSNSECIHQEMFEGKK